MACLTVTLLLSEKLLANPMFRNWFDKIWLVQKGNDYFILFTWLISTADSNMV